MIRRKVRETQRDDHKLIVQNKPLSPLSEQFRMIVENIELMSIDDKLKSILITSADPSSGKSIISSNLAIAFAQKGKKTLLIDADLRKPTIHKYFRNGVSLGLMGLIKKESTMEGAIFESATPNLFILQAGIIPVNPATILASDRLKEVLAELDAEFDHIIVDTPPILAVADAQILAGMTDASVLVIRNDYTVTDRARKASERLEQSSKLFLGAIFNNQKQKQDHYYYQESE
ncbi:CpsD/CapB family tyrosine-protein kinase [Listeria booriae]|uniref:non-specific protein-tyrosine kinase n=1 Tax=Listeria booriae TaxID=1552123 RepID=A0A7X1DQB7_9LIST|nr:CpsD/CapB family tyrosine-protein kinase [Listeria booriae]MBC1316799.1 CpsD/CapB family tyrosine-protein kinase [Listeria booriae]MBC2365506.1 CpsD/CapB family tyrosine-protein kinase [Listeria booriae]MBC2371501.1 CpsD/CapB family tyrosine-protein kinase [Listeria booriae]